jgi:hypothetical protein
MKHPYAVPDRLSPDLTRVQAYWRGLLRGGAEVPFADDARLTDIPDLVDRLVLIDVFERPERFRFANVGSALAAEPLAGQFIDEIDLKPPFDLLRTQCCATVESAEPTYLKQEAKDKANAPKAYARLLLPLWGDGRISMLLGIVDEA